MLALRAGAARPDDRSLVTLSAALLVTSLATLVASYVMVKLVFLVGFVCCAVLGLAATRRWVVYPRLVLFYAVMAAAGMAWAIVGLLHHGNHVQGVLDAIRLYAGWSLAFTVLFTLLRSDASRGLRPLHLAMVASGILIAAINLYGFADQVLGIGLVTEGMRRELDQYIAIHEGYIQITSQNIGALFTVVPYLLVMRLRTDAGAAGKGWTTVALVAALLISALSGRRALWLAVAVAPFTILILSLATRSMGRLHRWARRGLVLYCVGGVVAALTIFLLPDGAAVPGPVEHLQAAFSAQDERSIQLPHLVEGFKESQLTGSGFGAAARYLRDVERPWAGYELTYFQMLFNLGALGTGLLAGLVGAYLVLVIRILRRHPAHSAVPFGLLLAFCSLLIGAYSNRYFGSFDLLFFAGLLPYLATFTTGFAPAPAADAP